MTDLQTQTDQLMKAFHGLQDWLIAIHYDLLTLCVLVFVFGMLAAFMKRREIDRKEKSK